MKNTVRAILERILPDQSTLMDRKVRKYREFDRYKLDVEVHPARDVFVAAKLPSEPPEGITYSFGPSGYIGDPSCDYCVIPVTCRNVNNYCHWNFSELPFLFLAFESGARHIVLPDEIIEAGLPFQKRWMELLSDFRPEKIIHRASSARWPRGALYPVNHDTSSSAKSVGRCKYSHYHGGKTTPYLIDKIARKYKNHFRDTVGGRNTRYLYINRATRRLKNELEVQRMLRGLGFEIVDLSDLSLDEQVSVFANAEIIVGFHGAGLSNLLYAGESVKVFEIIDQDCVYPSYKDGLVIPGTKAPRTYFHLLCAMKSIAYQAVESEDYTLDLATFEKQLMTQMGKVA